MTFREQPKILPGSGTLTIEQVVGVAREGWQVMEIGSGAEVQGWSETYARFLSSRKWVEEAVEENERSFSDHNGAPHAFYGINTGFGSKAGSYSLPGVDIPWVSRNLIVSHAAGIGQALPPEVVRAAMLIRAHSLAQGYSGVRPEVVNLLVRMLNSGVTPVVPEHGSVGASGDLAPLSHLALVLSRRPGGEESAPPGFPGDYDESGRAFLEIQPGERQEDFLEVVVIDGKRYGILNGHTAMRRRGLEPIELGAKEGLAFNNGTTFSAALAALAVYDAENVARHAEIAAALSLEALIGFRDAYLRQVQEVRRHRGQQEVATRIRAMTAGSTLLDGDEDQVPRYCPPQDPYTLRVVPQVIGAVWDVLSFLRQEVEEELNAVTDNPLIFLDLPRPGYKSVSSGNFHGAPLAYAMDFLGIVMTDLGSLSERRTFRLTTPGLSQGLPAMLVEDLPDKPGRTSGLMIAQYLAAGLVSECKTLAHPDSVDSITTSANQEDHVSMSMNAARHARQIVANIEAVIAVELLCAHLGLAWRLEDIRQRLERQPDSSLPASNGRSEISRVDALTSQLVKTGQQPRAGEGCQAAQRAIEQALYPPGNALPMLGKTPTDLDRFTQPYLLRCRDLLRSGALVEQVYSAINLKK
ncbi:MAG TPA: aromatic amino acid lyase [Anaerolineaceae bacterium]